jgi:hypothetical protein
VIKCLVSVTLEVQKLVELARNKGSRTSRLTRSTSDTILGQMFTFPFLLAFITKKRQTDIPRHEEVSGSGGRAPSFLTSALDGVERPASRPCRFTLREAATRTPWKGSWLGPRTSLGAVEQRKISCLCRKSNSDPLAVQPVASRYTDCAIPALIQSCPLGIYIQ